MAAKFSQILKKKFVVVTGKGGSGKSLLSLALAHRLSSQGKRVWLVEIGRKRDRSFSRLPGLLEVNELGHKPTRIDLPGTKLEIEASVLNPTQSLAEYVDLKLPTGGFAGILLNNKVTASFLEVVPGLPDLVSLGKLWHRVTDPGKEGPDVVILDAPASGHALSLLRAPTNFERITKIGPIHRDARLMREFFSDPEQMAILLTTLPEEMSLRETLELRSGLKEFPHPHVVVNRCFPSLAPLAELKETLPYQAYEYSRRRSEREEQALSVLGREPYQSVPFFFPDPAEPRLYLRISEAL